MTSVYRYRCNRSNRSQSNTCQRSQTAVVPAVRESSRSVRRLTRDDVCASRAGRFVRPLTQVRPEVANEVHRLANWLRSGTVTVAGERQLFATPPAGAVSDPSRSNRDQVSERRVVHGSVRAANWVGMRSSVLFPSSSSRLWRTRPLTWCDAVGLCMLGGNVPPSVLRCIYPGQRGSG